MDRSKSRVLVKSSKQMDMGVDLILESSKQFYIFQTIL